MSFLYKKLINIGVDSTVELHNVKQIKLLNIYSLIWIHLGLVYSIHDIIVGGLFKSIYSHLITFSFMILVFVLTHKKKYFIAKLVWLFYSILTISIFSIYLEPGHFVEYFVFLFNGAALSLFRKNTMGYIFLPMSFLLFITPYYIIPSYPEDIVQRLQPGAVFGFTSCIFLLILNFKNQNLKNEKLLSMERDKVLSDKIILEDQKKELKKLNKFKSHFFINLSHEIRTPLTLIKGYREEIDFSKSNEENTTTLKIIDDQLTEIRSITDNIIDLSKLDEDKILLNKRFHSVNMLLNKLFSDFKTLFEQKNIEFNLTPLTKDIKVRFDLNLMNRSLKNILNNALKFTPKNGNVLLKAHFLNGNLHIDIIDNGIGIPENELTKIFNRFYQVKNDITESKGSGIGLAFSKNIIEEHQFIISVESKINEGSVFKVLIPKSELSTPDKIAISNTKVTVKGDNNNYKQKILLVDDHLQMRAYLKSLLHNYTVIEAENGVEALKIIEQTTIDFLLTDYMMPEMDGWELVKKVKEKNHQFPIFVITARVDYEGKLEMLRLGIDNYFTKPFYKEELLYSIEKALYYYTTLNEESKINPSLKMNTLTHKKNEHFKKQLEKILEKNISNYNFSVEDIAHELDISSKTLTRKTKTHFGQTPNQLIIEARLQKAKTILDTNPELSLTEITKLIGLKNRSYLKKRFEERFKS